MTLPATVDTLVIGAGISGLAYAAALREGLGPDADVLVLEASDRVGGLLGTASVDGPASGSPRIPRGRFELGAEALQLGPSAAAALERASGVPIRAAPATTRKRFLVHRGSLCALPMSPPALFTTPLLSFAGKLRALSEPFRRADVALEGSIAEFASHRFGREVLDALLDPFVSGVYAGDPKLLSMRASFPTLVEAVEQHGSVVRGMMKRPRGERATLCKPEGGMQRLPEGLAAKLGTRLALATPVRRLRRGVGSELVAELDSGSIRARRVVVATEAHAAARLVAELAPEAARALAGVHSESLAAVVHAWKRESVGHALDGFGFLAPSREKLTTLGTLFSSSIEPACAEPGIVVLRSLLGGARSPELVERGDEELCRLVLDENRRLLSLSGEPAWVRVVRYRAKIPRYDLEHPRRLAAIRADLARANAALGAGSVPGSGGSPSGGLALLGNAMGGIGVSALLAAADALARQDRSRVPALAAR